MTTPNLIRCDQCGHDNDLTRIFCQECGSRLERPEGVPTAAPPPPVAAGPDRKFAKIKKQRPPLGRLATTFLRLAILAAVLAAFIQMARSPSDVPPPVAPGNSESMVAKNLIETASQSSTPVSFGITQDAVNGLLASTIKMTSAESALPLKAEIQRIYVVFEPGAVQVGMEQKLLDWPVYLSIDVVPQKNGSAWGGRLIGAQIGRLPIHPVLAPLVQRLFNPVADALQPEFARCSRLVSVDLQPGKAVLNWSGGAPGLTP